MLEFNVNKFITERVILDIASIAINTDGIKVKYILYIEEIGVKKISV